MDWHNPPLPHHYVPDGGLGYECLFCSADPTHTTGEMCQEASEGKISLRLTMFLESYRDDPDVFVSLFGPTIRSTPPSWWQRKKIRKDRERDAKLEEHKLPPVDRLFVMRWFSQLPQQANEDARGYVHRRWMTAFGFDHFPQGGYV